MTHVPESFRPHIRVEYPPNNYHIFEEWFFRSMLPEIPAEYLPVFWTSYWVNHNYGNDPAARQALQNFVDQLPRDRTYFTVNQYDDGPLVDFKDLDIRVFCMSGHGEDIPLLNQPHPYRFNEMRDLLYSYVGSNTHPLRRSLKQTVNRRLEIKEYCYLHARSVFSLCPRGYGINSFRIGEALQYGAIPVYISDRFVEPFGVPIDHYMVRITPDQVNHIDEILRGISPEMIEHLQQQGQHYYQKFFTYEGCKQEILRRVYEV